MSNIIAPPEEIKEIRKLMEREYFDCYIGLDPGERLIVGGIRICENRTESIKIKSSTFYYMSSFYVHKSQQIELTRRIEQKSKTTISPNQADFFEYTKHRLRWFKEKQSVYSQRKLVRLKFKK